MAGSGVNKTLAITKFIGVAVKLHAAAREEKLGLKLLHAPCFRKGTPNPTAGRQFRCNDCGEIIAGATQTHGYVTGKNQWVELTDKELADQCSTPSDELAVVALIPLAEITVLRRDKSFFMGPQEPPRVVKGKVSTSSQHQAFEMFRQHLIATQRAAVVSYVERGHDKMGLIEPWDPGLLFCEIFFDGELRTADDSFKAGTFTTPQLLPEEAALGAQLFGGMQVDGYSFSQHIDSFIDRVRKVAEAKARGETLAAAPQTPVAAAPSDLLAALQASLAQANSAGKPPVKAEGEPPAEDQKIA